MLEVRVYSSPEQISIGFEMAEFTGVAETALGESGFFMLLMEDGSQTLLPNNLCYTIRKIKSKETN